MALSEQLTRDMQAALKGGQAERLGTLRLLHAAVANERIKLGHELSDDEVVKVLQREAKQRRDAAVQYTEAGRAELATRELTEVKVVEEYLPQPLSPDELAQLVDQAVAKLGPEAQIGAVIGAVMAEAGARAEGGSVARLVRERLNQS